MSLRYQLVIDCRDPSAQVRFWAPALGYRPKPPPDGHPTWNDWYRSVGIPDDELDLTGDGTDRLEDPDGNGADIWFQPVPETKSLKNRLHLDLHVDWVDGAKRPYDQRRPLIEAKTAELVAAGATVLWRNDEPEWNRFSVTLADREGNEFCLV